MIIESFMVLGLGIALDVLAGDPPSRYHPTAWVGRIIGKTVPCVRTGSPRSEKILGAVLVISVAGAVIISVYGLYGIMAYLGWPAGSILYVAAGAVLLKSAIAIRGMESHALDILGHLEAGRLEEARCSLARIVKRDTSKLDSAQITSGVLESVSENTVDGITGTLFYFGLFGIFGALVHRTISTFDSMIGYQSKMFHDMGWFAASCDRILNWAPSRVTALAMILSSMILGADWRGAYRIVMRDHTKTASPNSGYAMAALAGALGAVLVKPDHYTIGSGALPGILQIKQSVLLMKVTVCVFACFIVSPIILLSYLVGWWPHA